jgi:hypothetical protein
MNWIVYHAVSANNMLTDSDGNYMLQEYAAYLSTLGSEVQAIVTSAELFEKGCDAGFFPVKDKFHIVLCQPGTVYSHAFGPSVWVTDIHIKQVRRELKIQGFGQVLCLTDAEVTEQMIRAKFIQTVTLDIVQTIQHEGRAFMPNFEVLREKWTLLSSTLVNNVRRVAYQL